MLQFPGQIREMMEKEDSHSVDSFPTDDYSYGFSHLLNMLINNAKYNSNKDPKGYRYDECIRYFATYIYIMCGKACYETLSANLPIPKAQTIRTYFLITASFEKFEFVSHSKLQLYQWATSANSKQDLLKASCGIRN